MNNYFYSIIFVLSATFSLYSQTYNILVVQPKGSDYKKIELGLRSELNKTISIKSMVSKSETEITGSLNTDSPDLVVLMGIETIKAWKKIQQKNQNRYQIPSIMIDNEFSGINLTDISNSCSITYETKLKQYVNRFVHHTGKNPLNIGIVYSQKCSNLIQSYQSEASELGVNLHAKSVVISDPENSIKTIVNNFIEHYKVDFMIILDDNDVINNQNINTIWVSLLTPLKFPVAVPSDYFFEIEPRIGSFSIQPFYKEIGRVVASVINEASSNNWVIKQKSIYTDKSIFYYRNENGSISKKNQIENPIAVVYYPKTISTPVEEAVIAQHTPEPEVSSEALQQVASTLMNETNTRAHSEPAAESKEMLKNDANNITLIQAAAKSKDEVKDDANPISQTKAAAVLKEVVVKKPVASISSNFSTKKNSQSSAKTVTEDKHKNNYNEKKEISHETTAKELISYAQKENKPDNEKISKSNASNSVQYNVVITANTTSVFKNLAPDFTVLGVGRQGDTLSVSSEDSLWYCVNFFGTPGYLSKKQADRITKDNEVYVAGQTSFVLIITGLIIVGIMIILFFIFMFLKSKYTKGNGISCLLISKNKKLVKYSNINNNSTSLTKYLKNFGFHITNLKRLNQASAFLHLNIPEIICVDWKLETEIQEKIYIILKNQMLTADFLLIFYNVATPSSIKKSESFENRTFFFGKNLTISDLNSVLSLVKAKSDTLHEDYDHSKSCLEGRITEETLAEIFQMMETNKKTGCLVLENHGPFGMIFFEDGIITFAVTNTLTAEEAVFDILLMKHGRFHFLPGKTPTTRQMQLDTLAVLMERAKIDDEIQVNPLELT